MPAQPQKSLFIAYFLWFFLGIFGVHRLYLGKYFTGFLYAISCGFYAFGWFLDFFLLPFLVKQANARLARQAEEEEYGYVEEPVVVAPVAEAVPAGKFARLEPGRVRQLPPPLWVQTRSRIRPIEFLLRSLFFLAAPCIFVIAALMLEQYVLLAIMVVSLVVCGFLGQAETFLARYPMLEKVPLLGQALSFLQNASTFYRDQAPFHFAYYLFFPVAAPIALLVSPLARREVGFFGRIIGSLMLVVVARIGFSYLDVYPPHLGPQDAFVNLFVECVFVLGMMILFIVPTVTSALTLTACRQTTQLRVLMVLGLISGLPMGIAYFAIRGAVPYQSVMILEQRLNKTSFQKELIDSSTMFLTYWRDRAGDLEEKDRDKTLTEKFQRLIKGHMTGPECKAFGVLSWGSEHDRYVAVSVVSEQDAPYLLVVSGPGGSIYTNYADLPRHAMMLFRVGERPDSSVHRIIRREALIGDLAKEKFKF